MPATLRLPDLRTTLEGLRKRIEVLERRIREQPGAETEDELIFSLPGALVASTSPRGYVRNTSRLVNVVVSLGTAGSSTTTVLVKKNGSTIETITLGSGVNFDRTRTSVSFTADSDYMTVTVSGVGTGAADLTVQARFT